MGIIRTLVAVTLIGVAAASAQDVAGIEDCTKTQGLDKRTGCLQANVNFLQRTMARNAADAQRRLQAAESEITALRGALAALRKQVDELQATKAAADKKASEKKADDRRRNRQGTLTRMAVRRPGSAAGTSRGTGPKSPGRNPGRQGPGPLAEG